MVKFDFAIGNPPFQADVENEGDRANPVYDKFMEAAFGIADAVEMIHPGRFLFNAGQTPKAWNKKMLEDEHLKVMFYEQKSSEVFSGTDIKGGVAITYRDSRKTYEPIGTFTIYDELNSILKKVHSKECGAFFDTLVSSQGIFRFSEKAIEDCPDILTAGGKGTGVKIVSSEFSKLPNIFKNSDDGGNIKMLARTASGRIYRFIRSEYVEETDFTNKYKVIVPEANGSGAIGEVLSTPLIGEPLIGEPLIGVADTFLCIGPFDERRDAENALKYVKCKFARTMLGVNKITQHNPKGTWKDVPLQDFTDKSDINWNTSIANIDKQLYKKYNLTEEEINFIETHVKEME